MSCGKTHLEVLTDLMQFSRHGALAQVFIIDALQKQARRVAAADPTLIDSPLIAGKAWVGVASEIRDRLDEHYGIAAPLPAASSKVMLFAAFLEADEIVVDDYEADKVRLAPPGPDPQPYITTAAGELLFVNDQEIDLVDEESGSRGSFVDVEGASHHLLLHKVVRCPLYRACTRLEMADRQ